MSDTWHCRDCGNTLPLAVIVSPVKCRCGHVDHSPVAGVASTPRLDRAEFHRRRAVCRVCPHWGVHPLRGTKETRLGCGKMRKPCRAEKTWEDGTGVVCPDGRHTDGGPPEAPAPEVLAEFGTPQPRPSQLPQILVKSMLRWDCTERLVRSIKRWYPDAEILIADDSFETLPDEWPAAMQRTIAIPGVRWWQLAYDSGLAAGRLFLLQQATSDYIILCDDDYVFTAETRVHLLAEILGAQPDIGLAAGLVRMDGRTTKTWDGHFTLSDAGQGMRSLTIRPLETPWRRHGDIWFRDTELTWNFYAARRSVLLAAPWDPQYVIGGEHIDHFLTLHKAGVRVVQTPNVIVGHLAERPPEYQAKRKRGAAFNRSAMAKWGITKPPGHQDAPAPGIEVRDVRQLLADQSRERPNIVMLTVGHTGSSVVSHMLGRLGWNLGDADDQYGESVSVRDCNHRRDFSKAAEVLAALPEPWAIKDPRFCETLDAWLPFLDRYRPVLVWLTRDPEAVTASFRRRGESLRVVPRRTAAAQRHFDRWTGPKLQLAYEQLQAAVTLFSR